MSNTSLNTIAVVIFIAVCLFIGYNQYQYIQNLGSKVGRVDTIKVYYTPEPIYVKEAQSTLIIEKYKQYDSTYYYALYSHIDSLYSELRVRQADKIYVLDTIVNQDTLFLTFSPIYNSWNMRLNFKERIIEVVKYDTIPYCPPQSDDKWYYAAGGLVIGLLVGIAVVK